MLLVSVISYGCWPCCIEGLVSMVKSTDSYSLSAPLLQAFLSEPRREGCDEDIPFRNECSEVSLCTLSNCGSLYLFLSAWMTTEQDTDL